VSKGKANHHRVTVTLDADLFEAIAQSADVNDRKIEQEIRYRLRATVQVERAQIASPIED
jgi:hypothetical protein